MESRQYAGGPLVPVRYTIREQLERIGSPSSTAYPFSASYAYHPNGTVSEAEFYSAGSPALAKRYKYVFGAASYDALNRLRSADYSYWNGTGWASTLAYDLAGIAYDRAGNLTALQRYRESATLIDNLSYGYVAGTNRLGSVSEAAGASAEAWDAETGSFGYDANGNVRTAPAPYSISAVTYDRRNLPLSLTSGGVSTSYRYDEAGQRIAKQAGTGGTEVYLLDGAATLAVFTVDGAGAPTSWHFNVLAGDKVVGRQPSAGARKYYHTDLLGSTRAVVEGSAVVESYDPDPWGVLLPGRTLAGGTKEGLTGKERDAETGLDYFGARLYMSALGRWTSVDPLAEKHLEWSPYNYVLNSPNHLVDPDGQLTSPVYDKDGNLLGTDDQGFQGRPIVMDADNFRQGMSHDEALSYDLGTEGLSGNEALSRFSVSYRSLPSRPDYDGRLTFREAVDWYNNGGGRPLYVDGRSLNFEPVVVNAMTGTFSKPRITVNDVMNAPGGYIDTAGITERNTGLVYGTIKFTVTDARTGEVRLGGAGNVLDRYDFPENSVTGWVADVLGRGKPAPYVIFCYVCTNRVTPNSE